MSDGVQEVLEDAGAPSTNRIPELLFAAAVLGLGLWTLVQTTTIRIPGSVNAVGPRAFPYAIAAALILAGGVVLRAVWQGDVAMPEESEDLDVEASTDWVTVAEVAAAFMAHVVLIRPLGWGLAGAVLFAGTSWALGARPGRAIGIGLALGLSVNLAFVNLLNVYLPPGIFAGLGVFDG